MSPNLCFLSVCAATAAAAAIGWFAPPIRGRARFGEMSVWLASGGVALLVHTDWLNACSLALVFPGAYYTFSRWHEQTNRPFHMAFWGAVWFYARTIPPEHRSPLWLWPCVLVFFGPAAARWLTERTDRRVGLLLLVAATLFQLSRVPLLLAG